jgi:hypothetical protein
MRFQRFSGVVVLAVGLGLTTGPTGAGAADSVPPLVTTLETVIDSASDVVNTITSSLFDNPRADITAASVERAPGWIRMKVQVKTLTDPLRDKAWSDNNDAEWVLDTNGDGVPEYSVEFATDNGELYGAVFDATKPDEKSVCDADSASFSAEDGYTVVIDPKCIGNPDTLAYAVAIFFDTNPKDDNAPLATDRVPDQGFKAVSPPVQPGGAPSRAPASADTPTAPAVAPSLQASVPPSASQSTSSVPRAAASAPTPPAARMEASNGPVPATVAGQPIPAPAAPLARTGSASSEQALLGIGILLLGAGLLVMTRPSARTAPARF